MSIISRAAILQSAQGALHFPSRDVHEKDAGLCVGQEAPSQAGCRQAEAHQTKACAMFSDAQGLFENVVFCCHVSTDYRYGMSFPWALSQELWRTTRVAKLANRSQSCLWSTSQCDAK
jgi:hypothetical protein